MSPFDVSQRKPPESPAHRFVGLLAEEAVIVAPGVFNPIVAILARRAGARALYFSGAGLANSMGLPDLGLFTLSELSEAVTRITAVVELPLIVDVDTGFGSALNAARTASEMIRAGAAAIHLEDQSTPKRCGHLEGKRLIPVSEMLGKIIAAKEAARDNLIVIARTDARGVDGLEAAIERGLAYREAGADMIFPDALENVDEFAAFARRVQAPLMANMTEFGKTPLIHAARFQELGYRLVIFPLSAFRVTLQAADSALQELLSRGTQEGLIDRMMSRSELYECIDYSSYETADDRIARRAAGILLPKADRDR